MKVNVQKLLKEAGIDEPFYPGKRLVQSCRQAGEFKSHCVVLDWRDPGKVKLEVKAGLSGRDLAIEQLKNYPISFQTPTFVDIEIVNDNKEDDDEDGESTKGKGKAGGGSSKGQKKGKTLSDSKGLMNKAFSSIVEGKIPEMGKITDMVVMGMKIAEAAYEGVLKTLTEQISHAKIMTTELLAHAGKYITKYTPPSFLEPKGNEDKVYKYSAEKNYDIGFNGPSIG